MTIKELKEVCRCSSNNDFANLLSIYLHDASELAKFYGSSEYGDLLQKKSDKIYAKLSRLGYYAKLSRLGYYDSVRGNNMLEKSINLGKYFAYDEIISNITDLKVKYHDEALKGLRTEREVVEISTALDLVSSIARINGKEYLRRC